MTGLGVDVVESPRRQPPAAVSDRRPQEVMDLTRGQQVRAVGIRLAGHVRIVAETSRPPPPASARPILPALESSHPIPRPAQSTNGTAPRVSIGLWNDGSVEVAFAILAIAATVIAVTAVAERLRLSAPLLLVAVGIVASFVPFVREPALEADIVLFGLLPPLLYSAALRTSVLDLRANRRSIGFLSVGLVIFTALGVGLVAWLILPIPFAVAFALGAVVAPPDAVAATSIARRVGMPRRLVTILEGESLVNDATAITCLRVAIVAMSSAVTVLGVTVSFLIAAVGGLVVGLIVAAVAIAVRKRLHEPVFDTAISLLVPFAAYLPAEAIEFNGSHGSGVIAVVVAGLVLGTKSPSFQSGRSRLSERVNWATIVFLLENAVFLLIGLQARRIFTDVGASDLSDTPRHRLLCRRVGAPSSSCGWYGCSPPSSSCSGVTATGTASALRGSTCSWSAGPGCAALSRWPRPS